MGNNLKFAIFIELNKIEREESLILIMLNRNWRRSFLI